MSRSSVYSQTHNDGEEDEDGYEEEGILFSTFFYKKCMIIDGIIELMIEPFTTNQQ